ncbi:hypothetical protein D7V64_00420 [Acinetobacter cumulans]|uniref:DUF7944 domain-containing protein n=1 Tax=Acinetobacter cumulans TaxID=2136182 RepID=A0A3A8GAI0_9GAMM|nr:MULTISPECIES: hypothetical protein [Acinetobacter]NWK74054.1 hypothetical protein [Acinetobacter sp. SwsAc6]RFS31287.1 hypothetical protein DYI81_08140 [Acinetobacter sp. SWAC5]RKG44420.1 hypothetical protein D7V51_07990 [Acinetobacter cumulans]RKG47597.1 hypothetical protein D7V68_10950 [Acinetobacter cumulans]RKG55609.1 hypothetical protein D7V64_00420 [Acinetobacter cumulans]
MITTLSFRRLLGLSLAAVLSQAVIADEGLTPAEANTIIKEDIASTQVMAEVCPAIIGKNAKFDSNIQSLIKSYLADYSEKSMTYEKLQADAEYKSFLAESRTAAKESSKEEQKSVCDDVLNYEEE